MRVLLVRAGALGDVLLLRSAIRALASSSCVVALLAPERAAAALAPPEVDELIAWEGRDVAALLAGPPSAAFASRLHAVARVVAYTRDQDLLRGLRESGARVVAHDPTPPPGRHAADWLAE